MKTNLYSLVVLGMLSLLFLQGCGKAGASLQNSRLPNFPSPSPSPQYSPPATDGELRVASSQSLGNQGMEVTFVVEGKGAARYRYTANGSNSPVDFMSTTTYKKIYPAGTTQGSESGILELFNTAGQSIYAMSLQTGTFQLNNPGQAMCNSITLNPDPIRLYLNANGGVSEPAVASLRLNTSSNVLMDRVDLVSGAGASALVQASNGTAHYADLKFTAPGNYSFSAHFIGGPNGVATCSVQATVIASQLAPKCTLALSGTDFSVGASEMATVTATMIFSNAGGQVDSASINNLALSPSNPSMTFNLPKGTHILHGLAKGPGGNGVCDSAVIQVTGKKPTCKLTANKTWLLFADFVIFTIEQTNLADSGPITSADINGAVATTSSNAIYVNRSGTYTATVKNENGSSSCSRDIAVTFGN